MGASRSVFPAESVARRGIRRFANCRESFRSPIFRSNLCGLIQSTLETAGISPECLDLELTESLLISDVDQAIAIFENLSALGVQASIDDFGTGSAEIGRESCREE